MKKLFTSWFVAILTIIVTQHANSQQTAVLKEIELDSKILFQKRPIYVYTPWEYAERDLVSFDVIYVFDAQNREFFDLVHASLNYIFPTRKFIVVGISSPSYDEIEYYRNSDFLPKPIKVGLEKYQTDNPNAENFWKYFTEEVIPFVNKNHRTTNVNYLIGHSLSGSFVLDKAIHNSDAFKGFVCISPNLAYDENRLANDFLQIDYNKPAENNFLFISQSNEPNTWAKSWGDAYRKVKSFVENSTESGKYDIFIRDFPTYNHQSTVIPAVIESLNLLATFIDKNPYSLNGRSENITLKVTVSNREDEVYITGNQESLGNWNPSKVKLKKVSDFERELNLVVKFPIEFKLTKGNWETEGFTNQTSNLGENIVIDHPKEKTIHLKINAWEQ